MPKAYKRVGAIPNPDGTVTFSVWAPSAGRIDLILDKRTLPMSSESGWHTLTTHAIAGCHYQFVTDEGLRFPDPASRAQAGDVHDQSIVVDHSAYAWRTNGWRNRPWHEAVIYELHVGALGGFAGVRSRLPHIASLGVTVIELMPVADFPGKRNWGYDGVLPFAPDASYGKPEDLKALVDDAHALGLMVILDVVYNHFGPDGAYIHTVAKSFFDEELHTPWGAAIDFKNNVVRQFFIDNALMWLRDYRMDGLRFDAVHAINPSSFLEHLEAEIRRGIDGPVHLVLENEENRASLLRADGASSGYDAQWADDFHHCVHVLLTQEQEGYYADFSDPTQQLVRVLSEGFAYQGETPPHYGRPRGEPSSHLPTTAFVVCLQNHDQIGNRAFGERLTAIADPKAMRAALALLLLCPFIPLIFMGDEWGAESPFLFFTDHGSELAEMVRTGRRKEFAHFKAFQNEGRTREIPDPNAHATFDASIPRFSECSEDRYHVVLQCTRALLGLRARYVTPGILGARSAGATMLGDKAVRAKWVLGNGNLLTIQSNFSAVPLDVDPADGDELLCSDVGAGHDVFGSLTTQAYLKVYNDQS